MYIQKESVSISFFLLCHFQVKVFMVSETSFTLCVIFVLSNVLKAGVRMTQVLLYTQFVVFLSIATNSVEVGTGRL